MRLLHTSDWHLGHTLKGWDRKDEHDAFLTWLVGLLKQQQVDVLLIAGDVFDVANPTASAQETWYAFLAKARRENPDLDIVVIGGNHDSASRLDAPNPLLRALGVTMVGGFVRRGDSGVDLDSLIVPVRGRDGEGALVLAIPFLRPPDLPLVPDLGDRDALVEGMRGLYREATDRALAKAEGRAVVAMGHLYMAGGTLSELSERRILGGNQHALPTDLFPRELAYVALGHLHRAQRIGGEERVRYSGSPIPLSMAEASYHHQVVVVDIRGGVVEDVQTHRVPHRVEMMRIPKTGAAPLPEVIKAVRALPPKGLFVDPLSPFLQVTVSVDKPEPTLNQQVQEAASDRAVRLLAVNPVATNAAKSGTDPLQGKALDDVSPEHVFIECHRSEYGTPPSGELLTAFHELMAVAQAGPL
jgi:exonuclease SbcD